MTDSYARDLAAAALSQANNAEALAEKLKSIGKFLSAWDATTGLPESEPETIPYTYSTGDYYIVSAVAESGTNYKPSGTVYTGDASTEAETESVAENDFYFFDGATWMLLKHSGGGAGGDTAGVVAPAYSAESTYSQGDLVIKNQLLYKALEDIDTPEAFDPTKWEKTTVDAEIPVVPVKSVNTLTGDVTLTQDSVGDGATYKRVTADEKTTWNNKENASNKVTVINDNSTDTQYPSAKAVNTLFQGVKLVSVTSINNEAGTVTDASGLYSAGNIITITATPADGYTFLRWIDGYSKETLSADATYTFTVTRNISIVAAFIEEDFQAVPWATGTDTELAKMIAYADAGIVNLSDYWSVGDSRTISLSAMENSGLGDTHAAQDVEFVIKDFVCDGFTSGGKKPNAIVGMKNALSESGKMNTSNTNSGGWMNCPRRSWCNDTFKNAVPSGFRSIFKNFVWQTGKGGGASSGLNTTEDTFALAPAKAVFGSASYSFSDEAALYSQWQWYKTAANRIKKYGADGSAASWWEASPYSGNSYGFCAVGSYGSADILNAGNSYGLAPFGCI